MLLAITREISPAIAKCELTHLSREPIDLDLARTQHRQYTECLAKLGCTVQQLPAEADLPDSVFVEDTAVVLDEVALITRPGADSRKPETESIARALAPYRQLLCLAAPGALDGGDVLHCGRELFVGLSGRSNQAGIDQMTTLLRPFGYRVTSVNVNGCLHLKSAVTEVAEKTLLINSRWIDPAPLSGKKLIEVDDAEPFGANALLINDTVLYPSHFSATRRILEANGIKVITVDASELGKAEGGVTCCSLIFNV